MNQEFQTLLARAAFLSPKEKEVYGLIFDYLDETKRKELKEMIENAVNEEEIVNNEAKKAKSDAVREFIAACDTSIKTEFKAAKDEEENATKESADKLLENLQSI